MAGETIPEPVKVRLHRRNTVVIVVDMQNDFCKPSGKLFVPASLDTIPKIGQVLELSLIHISEPTRPY